MTLVPAFSKKGLFPKQQHAVALVTGAARAGSPVGAGGLPNTGEESLAPTKCLVGEGDL